MDQQKSQFECRLITFNELQLEKYFLGKMPDQVQKYMGKEADVNNGNEWIYIIKRFATAYTAGSCIYTFMTEKLKIFTCKN